MTMNIAKIGLSLGIAATLAGTVFVDTADAAKNKKTTKVTKNQTSDASAFSLDWSDTNSALLLCYDDQDTNCDFANNSSETGLLVSPAEGNLNFSSVSFESDVLEFSLFFNDVTLKNQEDNSTLDVDFQFDYEFDFNSLSSSDPNFNPTFLEVNDINEPGTENSLKLQKILDLIAIGDPNYDIFDSGFKEGLRNSSVPSDFGSTSDPNDSGGGEIILSIDGTSIQDSKVLREFMEAAHGGYAGLVDPKDFTPEPLNGYDKVKAEGDDLVDVPEPGSVMGLLAMATIGSVKLLTKKDN